MAASFVFCSAAGTGVDILSQKITHSSQEKFEVDWGSAIKTGILTGVASIVPTIVNPAASITNAIGASIVGMDAAIINSVIDIIYTNLMG